MKKTVKGTIREQLIEKITKKWFADFHKFLRVCDLEACTDILLFNFVDSLPDEMSIPDKVDRILEFAVDVEAKRKFIKRLKKSFDLDDLQEEERYVEVQRNIFTREYIYDALREYLK